MPILTILIVIVVAGVILWLVNSYIPMQRTIKYILNAVAANIPVVWLLNGFVLLDGLKFVKYHFPLTNCIYPIKN